MGKVDDFFYVGAAVEAQFTEDDVWYAAVINEITEEQYHVTYTDYGNEEDLPADRLRPVGGWPEEVTKGHVWKAHPSTNALLSDSMALINELDGEEVEEEEEFSDDGWGDDDEDVMLSADALGEALQLDDDGGKEEKKKKKKGLRGFFKRAKSKTSQVIKRVTAPKEEKLPEGVVLARPGSSFHLGQASEAENMYWRFKVKIGKKDETSRKRRNLDIDPHTRMVTVVDKRGRPEHEFNMDQLVTMEKSLRDPQKLRLLFKDEEDATTQLWEMRFTSVGEREHFAYFARSFQFSAQLTKNPNMRVSRQHKQTVSVFMGTWNVGNAPPEVDSFEPWLHVERGYDVYVIGAQECQYDPREGFSTCEEDWFTTVEDQFGSAYATVAALSMWEIRLIVLARREHFDKITNVDVSTEATGIGHVLGNKGGVAISLRWQETSMCFVNSHLAAHQNKIAERNADYREIIGGMRLGMKQFELTAEFDHVFWCGDLNYRIDRSRAETLELIEAGDLTALLETDQLNLERGKDKVFVGFEEGTITFTPTYKFDRGCRVYTEEKQRVPSWCDRVLWKSNGAGTLKQVEYAAAHELMSSDHSPVYAVFDVDALVPFIPDAHSPPCEIVLRNLSAHGLHPADPNGLADPYLKFRAMFVEKKVVTATQKKTLSPEWKDEVCMRPFIPHEDFLRHQKIMVEVWDWDMLSTDDMMAQGVVSLAGVFASDKRETEFEVPVYKSGVQAGVLHGVIAVSQYGHSYDK